VANGDVIKRMRVYGSNGEEQQEASYK